MIERNSNESSRSWCLKYIYYQYRPGPKRSIGSTNWNMEEEKSITTEKETNKDIKALQLDPNEWRMLPWIFIAAQRKSLW